MTQAPVAPPAFTAADYDRTLILAVEVSDKSWVVAAQVPGPSQGKAKRTLEPTAEALMAAIELYTRRAAAADLAVERVIVVYEAGYSGFWLARWLVRHGVEPFVIQPSSVPVDRRMRRAKSDASRQVGCVAPSRMGSTPSCCCARCWPGCAASRGCARWGRSRPRPMRTPGGPSESARSSSQSGSRSPIGSAPSSRRWASVATTRCGATGGNGWMACGRRWATRSRRMRAKIERVLDRLELVLAQTAELERCRDMVLNGPAADAAERMIQQLVRLRGIGVQSATLLVREAFVRPFGSGKSLGAYAGLTPTPYSSGGREREQGIGKAGNARLRTAMVELAWIWQRYQPDSAAVRWFRERLGGAARRVRKVMVGALARKLLVALWRFASQGVLPEGAVLKPAT